METKNLLVSATIFKGKYAVPCQSYSKYEKFNFSGRQRKRRRNVTPGMQCCWPVFKQANHVIISFGTLVAETKLKFFEQMKQKESNGKNSV